MNCRLKIMAIFMVAMTIGQMQGSSLNPDQEFYSILVPGQNGLGGDSFKNNGVINTENHSNFQSLGVNGLGAAQRMIDLGQDNCVESFKSRLYHDGCAGNSKNLLFGVSQGTATLVNFLAKKTHAEQEAFTKGLVLESVLGSGNSAILHTVSNVPVVTYIPFARLWAPWVAKVFAFPYYKPYGQQVFSSIKKISPNIPVVMMHDVNDPQLSINDARQAYVNAKKAGHNRVYLMETENNGEPRHFDLLGGDPLNDRPKNIAKIAALQAIYKKERLPFTKRTATNNSDEEAGVTDFASKIDQTNLAEYQPSVEVVQTRINNTSRLSFWTRNIIDAAAFVGIAWGHLL